MVANKKKQKKAAAAAITLAGMLVVLSACGSGAGYDGSTAAGREVIKKPDKTITVVDEAPAQADQQMEVSKIDELKGIHGLDWLSEDKIIVDKENLNMKPVTIEGEQRYPRNLYIRDLAAADQEDEAVSEEQDNQSFALLSADKKYLFYKKNSEDTATGYIMDMATRESVQTGEGELHANDGEWIDNERVIFSLINGSIVTSDVKGNTTTVLPMEDFSIMNATQRGTTVYYTSMQDKLHAYDTLTDKQTVLDSKVIWFVPTPDNKQTALVKRTSETEMELTITDSALKKKWTLVKATQVLGMSWSPDGTKLAYIANSQGDGVNGVFVADSVSGKTTPISVDSRNASGTLRWSPSGDKLLTSSAVMEENKVVFHTYVISFQQ
ncbi:PD40 domain-containing protein [Paenibacillus sepulcri]|uniref:PD40 domain-containing protein n=1 Tax=Paenibacillus sepulcri TaxID=359917 RepID=A0ABS7C0R3_9BACL|nr:PD40 domain-containing protein [Paenibacillus sepulcri]